MAALLKNFNICQIFLTSTEIVSIINTVRGVTQQIYRDFFDIRENCGYN